MDASDDRNREANVLNECIETEMCSSCHDCVYPTDQEQRRHAQRGLGTRHRAIYMRDCKREIKQTMFGKRMAIMEHTDTVMSLEAAWPSWCECVSDTLQHAPPTRCTACLACSLPHTPSSSPLIHAIVTRVVDNGTHQSKPHALIVRSEGMKK